MAEFGIDTARLRLRAWREGDRERFTAMLNSPAMMRYLGGPKSRGEIDALFDKRIADQARDGICYWAVTLRGSGDLVGSAGLRIASDYPGTPVAGMLEAGWRIAERAQRRGLAAEAMAAAIAWAWDNRHEQEIAAWTTSENAGSLALMRRLGFVARPDLDFIRPGTGESCRVHVLARSRAVAALAASRRDAPRVPLGPPARAPWIDDRASVPAFVRGRDLSGMP